MLITKQARSNFVGIEDSNLEKMKELREPRIVLPEPRKPGNESFTVSRRGRLGLLPRPNNSYFFVNSVVLLISVSHRPPFWSPPH